MKKILLACLLFLAMGQTQAQMTLSNSFDGADTFSFASLRWVLDTAPNNIWQVGAPQKTVFNSALSAPNTLTTDTLQVYPINNLSILSLYPFDSITSPTWGYGSLGAVRWAQKLDMEMDSDGGWVEFSADSGQTWQNALNNPYVYNYFGYDLMNLDTLASGEFVFSGTDSIWRDIWLCFDMNWARLMDLQVRFVFKSDSIDTPRDGWMIDNLSVGPTFVHTANKSLDELQTTKIFPNPATDRVTIELPRTATAQIIETLELYSLSGQLIQRWETLPAKFFISVRDLPAGLYFVKVKGSKETKFSSYPLIVSHR